MKPIFTDHELLMIQSGLKSLARRQETGTKGVRAIDVESTRSALEKIAKMKEKVK